MQPSFNIFGPGPGRVLSSTKGSVVISKLSSYFSNSPIQAIALFAALIAIATTPIAFAILGRLDWFKARRGRVMMKPEFSSIVVGHDARHGHPGDLRGAGHQERVLRQGPLRVRPQQDLVGPRARPRLQGRPGRRPPRQGRDGPAGRDPQEPGRTTSRSSTRRCWSCGPRRASRPRRPRRSPPSSSAWPRSARRSPSTAPSS